MKKLYIKDTIAYNGTQLQSHFAYQEYGLLGDSIIAFRGACNVNVAYMVDIEDRRAGNLIYSDAMLHFIIEHHRSDIEKSVLHQWLFASIVRNVINSMLKKEVIKRKGSDLYDGDAKVSISVATVTPLSAMMHFGINITSVNTPVKTKGLDDYGIDPEQFARKVMDRYVEECAMIEKASHKVTWIK